MFCESARTGVKPNVKQISKIDALPQKKGFVLLLSFFKELFSASMLLMRHFITNTHVQAKW